MLEIKNRIVLLLMTGAVLWLPSMAMAVDGRMNVSLKVKPSMTKDKSIIEEEKTAKNGDDRSLSIDLETEVCTLEVLVRQRGVPSGSCQLEWYFISDNVKNIRDKGVPVVFDAGKKTITLEENVSLEDSLVSKEFELRYTTQSYDSNKDDALKGDSYKGYVVLVTSEGEILAKASNSTRFLKGEWLEMCQRAGAGL